jgi:hypothetical protein
MTVTLEREVIAPEPDPVLRPSRWRRLRSWLLVPDHATALLIFTAALVIGSWNVTGSPAFQDDEGTYVAQAVAVQNGQLAPYTYWYDHPPLGWIQLAALGWIPQLLNLGAGSDLAAMRYVAALLFAITATLVYLLARRIRVRLPFAAFAAAVFVCSPLSLTLGRQVYLDTVALPWILFAFYLALSPGRALWHHVGAGVAFAIGVLSKLTVAVFGPALLVAMLGRGRFAGRSFSIVGFLGIGTLVLTLYPMMAVLRGELFAGPDHVSLQDAMTYQFLSRSGSGWIWEPDSSRYELLQSWLFLDTYLLIGGVVGAIVCLLEPRTRWIGIAIACFAIPVVASQGYLPAMYIIGILPFLALAIGAAAHMVWRNLRVFMAKRMSGTRLGPVLGAAFIGLLLVLIPVEQWVTRGAPLLATADQNRDWRSALEWVDDNVPRDEVIVVPYSMWQDVDKLGWNDPWQAIVLEKVDLDSQFETEHPEGWRAIDWIVEGPTVAPNIDYLALEKVRQAYDDSRIVASFGPWHIREVTPGAGSGVDTTTAEGMDQ